MTLKIAIFVSSLDNCGKRYPLDQICRHGKINNYWANNFIDELVFELKIAKNVKNTNWSPKLIFSMKKKIRKIPMIFDIHRKLTLKVKFLYFLTAPHYSNFQNLVISFEYSWFLAKLLSNFVSLSWKLHDQYCHITRFKK